MNLFNISQEQLWEQFITNFHFLRPEYLWLLFIIPSFIFIKIIIKLLPKLLPIKTKKNSWEKICSSEILEFLYIKNIKPKNKLNLTIFLILTWLILAISGPTWSRQQAPVYQNKNSWIICLSLSDTMLATDLTPSRLQRAKYKIKDFLTYIKDEQLALVVFTNDAYDLIPLTTDKKTIEHILPNLEPLIMPDDGSDLNKALIHAQKLIKNINLKNSNLLLLTDDNATAESLLIAKSLGENNVNINVINLNKSKNNGFNNSMQELSALSNGIYQELTSDDQDLKNILGHAENQFKQIYQKELAAQETEIWYDYGPWLLLFLLPLFVVHFYGRKYQKYSLIICFFILTLNLPTNNLYAQNADYQEKTSIWHKLIYNQQQLAEKKLKLEDQKYIDPNLFSAPEWQAAAEYHNKNYIRAEEILKKSNFNNNQTNHYNYANSLAKQGKIAEAIAEYNKILGKYPKNSDALFNKELLEKYQQQKENKSQNQNPDKNQNNNTDNNQDNNKQQNEQKSGSKQNKNQNINNNNLTNSDNISNNNKNTPSKNNMTPDDNYKQDETNQLKNQSKQNKTNPNQDGKDQEAAITSKQNKTDPELEKWLNKIPDNPAIYLKNQIQYEYWQKINNK